MACIENWMQKAEDNSKNINNLHAQKNRKGSALITQKKTKRRKRSSSRRIRKRKRQGRKRGTF